ncbi:hypothetical protein [Streptomyces canus]|uniref:hypothetical protein n=1 Tax=Streptomyces canus TaxID=58343 RepID=UPI002DD878B5|nr:hypothetical protein [Streptomyces canus]WSD82854.1 hypothetical protein OG925_00095 [Streptomyces canus]WSD91980.1 hypothetical protein OG925_50385 [Streptomyces canus]WSD92529.1 hypothetical protein OG925_50570 [Streptomyces canus]
MDRRLIRTAVFGSPDSDEPALCPETPEELDAFRREYDDVPIWCGTKFEGGCGRQLMTRRCTNKVCHFAHYGSGGDGSPCGRNERGKDSANHLFAKAHLASWLREQGISADFTYPEPLGSAVLVHVEDGRTLLVHLDRTRPVDWESGAWETILGPGVRITPGILAQRGYVHRIRFDDRPGGGRTMQFGTEIPGEGSQWDSLDAAVLTSAGLLTKARPAAAPAPAAVAQPMSVPAERAIVAVTPSAGRISARRADPVQQALLHLDVALRDHPGRILAAVEAVRRLLETDQRPEEVGRLRLALGRGERWLEERARLRRIVVQRLKEQPTPELLKQAARLVRDRDASAEEREAVAAAEVHVRRTQEQKRADRERAVAEQHAAEEHERTERRNAQQREQAEARGRHVHQARVEKVEKFVLAVRGAGRKSSRRPACAS